MSRRTKVGNVDAGEDILRRTSSLILVATLEELELAGATVRKLSMLTSPMFAQLLGMYREVLMSGTGLAQESSMAYA